MDQTFSIRIPIPLIKLGIDQDEIQRRVNEWLTISLFSDGRISSGKAARFLNISRNDFLALLRSKGIAFINYTENELEEEFEAVKELEVIEK
jgi:predicted HTH domain antitoxin